MENKKRKFLKVAGIAALTAGMAGGCLINNEDFVGNRVENRIDLVCSDFSGEQHDECIEDAKMLSRNAFLRKYRENVKDVDLKTMCTVILPYGASKERLDECVNDAKTLSGKEFILKYDK